MRKRFLSFVLVFLMLLTTGPGIVLAQEGLPEEGVPSPGNITLDFRDADIQNVLKIVALKSGVNIVAGPEVTGTVTIRLQDVPWEKALDVLLKTYGFVYEREENIIRVTTIENLAKETLHTELFLLNYAKAEEVVASVEKMLTERGNMRYDERTNALIVTDIPTNLYKIGQVIERLDKRTPQVMIDARLLETTLADYDKLGIDWTLQATAAGAKRPTTLPFQRRKPVLGSGLGLEKFLPLGDPASTSPAFPDVEGGATTDFPYVTSALGTTGYFTFGTLDFTAFQAVLEILQSNTDTKVISHPRITTLNNKEARILVGEIFNVPLFERNSTTGDFEITGYDPKELGVRLKVTPHVNERNEIVVDLKPEVSSFLGLQQLTSDLSVPRFSTREAETQIMVKDGETIVIGGLIKETAVDYEKKVPILGSVPFLGYLFKKEEKTTDTTDLLIFVTVRLVQGGKAPAPAKPQVKEAATSAKSQVQETVTSSTGSDVQESPQAATEAATPKKEGNKGYIFKK